MSLLSSQAPRPGAARWSVWWFVLALLSANLAPQAISEAAAATTKASKASAKKKSAKKTPSGASKKPSVKPVRRDVHGPQTVADADDTAAEGELDDEGSDAGDAESELEAIERELLAQASSPEPEVGLPEPAPAAPLTPKWVKHALIPGETLEDVARRFQVPVSDLVKWNGLRAGEPIPKKKTHLRVHTTSLPAPREKIEHVVRRGDTWDAIAKKLGVAVADLRKWNPRLGDKLDPNKKHKVVAWRDLDVAPTTALATKLGQIRVRAGGYSIGRPNRGKLVRGVELPDR
ncbi:MAG TPA: LysM peptidoglycan-binding domain-containing protein, partial [Nannocystis sp.]